MFFMARNDTLRSKCPACNTKFRAPISRCENCGIVFLKYRKQGAETPKDTNRRDKIKGKTIQELKENRKSGAMAAGLNLVIPGAGYMYCGRWFLGIIALVFVVAMVMAFPPAAFGLVLVLVLDGFLAAGRHNKLLDRSIQMAMKTCPQCAELVLPAAKVCKHCGNAFQPAGV
jgi:hypothetical protein